MSKNIPEFKGTIALGLSSTITSKSEQSKAKKIPQNGNSRNIDKRHEEAERKRLESIKRQRESFIQKKNAISSSLKSIDRSSNGAPINKKIKFASSSSESDEEPAIESKSTTTAVLQSNGGPTVAMSSDKRKLFDESDEEDDSGFNVPEYSGTVGSKLLQLQSKFGGVDRRFRLDERFLEDNNEPSTETDRSEPVDKEDIELKQDRQSDIRILEKVLGKTLDKPADEKAAKKSKYAAPYLRYDPENPSHRQFEVKENVSEEPDVQQFEESSESSSSSSESESVNGDHFADGHELLPVGLDPEFAETLRRKQAAQQVNNGEAPSASGFSLRKLFGREETSINNKKVTMDATATSLDVPLWQRPLMRIRDSSSEDEEEPQLPLEVEKKFPKGDAKGKAKTTDFFLFYDSKDKRIAEGEKFRRTQDVQTMRAIWEKQRVGLLQFCKSRRKEALKHQKQRNERNKGADVGSTKQNQYPGNASNKKQNAS